jgi:biotin synthase
MVRLSAGRLEMPESEQALCFLAGANSIFAGDKLLTTPNPSIDRDSSMLATLGLTPRVSSVSSQATASSCSSPSNPAGTNCCDGQGQAH